MIVLVLVLVGLVLGLSVCLTVSVFRIRDARNHIEFLSDAQAKAQELRIDAERAASASQTELEFLRNTVAGILQRPAVAVVTDQILRQFANIVRAVVHPEKTLN